METGGFFIIKQYIEGEVMFCKEEAIPEFTYVRIFWTVDTDKLRIHEALT